MSEDKEIEVIHETVQIELAVIQTVISDYYSLVERAIKIVSDAPLWTGPEDADQIEHASIRVLKNESGTGIILSWLTIDQGSYDGGASQQKNTSPIPIELFALSDADLDVWKAAQKAAYDKRIAEQQERDQRGREQQERMIFERLRQKFEPKA